MSVGSDLSVLYTRELDRLAGEIAAYPTDADIWSTIGGQKNAAGTLALHVAGGLLAYIGAGLGDNGYVRDRDREFSQRDLSRDEVVRRVRECRDTVVPILRGLDDAAMAAEYPGPTPPPLKGVSTQGFTMHLLWHLGWHLGHVYYHRLGLLEPASTGA